MGAVLRLWLSLNDDGIYWPDEIYQSVEPAHRLVFGYGLVAWEFREGARNWMFPGLTAGLLQLATAAGLGEPRSYLLVLRVAFSAVNLAAAGGTYLLARRLGSSTLAAAASASLIALASPLVYFAPRGLSEVPSTALVVFGFALALPGSGRIGRLGGSSLLGLSVLLRPQSILFAGALPLLYAARQRWRDASESALTLVAWLLLLGALDRLTWGGWFASLINYVSFNLDPVKTTIFDKAPSYYYVLVLLTSMTAPALALISLASFGAARAPSIAVIATAFIAIHSAIPHKELRFLLPAIPLLASVASLGIDDLAGRLRWGPWVRWALAAAVVACAGLSAATFHQLTFRDIGQSGGRAYMDHAGRIVEVSADQSAYDQPGALDRLLLAAHARPDLCGLIVEPLELVYTGGYSYLHRPVPLYDRTTATDAAFYNYAITFGAPATGDVVASEAGFFLTRTRSGCVKDPGSPPP